jgi:prevent-host-death family protein
MPASYPMAACEDRVTLELDAQLVEHARVQRSGWTFSGLPRFRHFRSRPEVYSIAYSRRMAKHVPVREFRSRLSELLNDVVDRRDHILVTRNGKPAAALVPIDEYQALEETAEILSDPDAIAAIEAGLADLNRGDTLTLDALRAELAERRRAL